MSKTLEQTESEAIAEVMRELDALGPDDKLSHEDFMRLLSKLPKPKPGGPTSAEIIRELRGPLPEHDAE